MTSQSSTNFPVCFGLGRGWQHLQASRWRLRQACHHHVAFNSKTFNSKTRLFQIQRPSIQKICTMICIMIRTKICIMIWFLSQDPSARDCGHLIHMLGAQVLRERWSSSATRLNWQTIVIRLGSHDHNKEARKCIAQTVTTSGCILCVFHVPWSKLLFIVILPEALTIWMLGSYALVCVKASLFKSFCV